LKLFTGTVGFIQWEKIHHLVIILLGNILGCFLVSLIAKVDTVLGIQTAAQTVLQSRLQLGWLACGIKAIGCGVLMSAAVEFSKRGADFGYWVPLLFAVPLFIHCGFPHCVADAFYFLTCPQNVLMDSGWDLLGVYGSIVVGNSIGCNIYRLMLLWGR
jgi:formate/nitrite transporter FocA (FNT family)